jgi:hypothetical protein
VFFSAPLVFNGCAGTAKREATALTEAVDRFRNASDASRTAMAEALAAVTCSDARVCDAKQACVAAVDPTARALALKDEVGRKLTDIEAARLAPDSPEAQALPVKLDEATRLLREGHKKMDECDTKLTDLRVTYGS